MKYGKYELRSAAAVIMYESPVWEIYMDALNKIVDEIYVRVDTTKSTQNFIDQLLKNPKIKSIERFTDFKYIVYKETLMRMLDKAAPDIAILLDHDEVLGDSIVEEIGGFWESDKKAMMFSYNPCPSINGRKLPVYPPEPHCKVFKWVPGLSFIPYMSHDQVTQYFDPKFNWIARTKVNHYCMYTPEMEASKKPEVLRLYGIDLNKE